MRFILKLSHSLKNIFYKTKPANTQEIKPRITVEIRIIEQSDTSQNVEQNFKIACLVVFK